MVRIAWLVATKELRIEARSRVVLWQVLPFAVMALFVSGLALGPVRVAHSPEAPGLFYIVTLFVTFLLVNRSRALDDARGTRESVATLGLDPAGVFLGKCAAVAVELWLSALVLLTGSVLVLHVSALGTLRAAPSVAVALVALAAAGTLYGALAAGGSGLATLLPVVSLPAFAPLLIAGERCYSDAVHGGPLWQWWVILLVALVVYLAVGILLYGVVDES
jgi:heme exporter protein B